MTSWGQASARVRISYTGTQNFNAQHKTTLCRATVILSVETNHRDCLTRASTSCGRLIISLTLMQAGYEAMYCIHYHDY